MPAAWLHPRVTVVRQGSGTLAADASERGFEVVRRATTDGNVALVLVQEGVVRIPLDGDAHGLGVTEGGIPDGSMLVSARVEDARPEAGFRFTNLDGQAVTVPYAPEGALLIPLDPGHVLSLAQSGRRVSVTRYAFAGGHDELGAFDLAVDESYLADGIAGRDAAVVAIDAAAGRQTLLVGLDLATAAPRWRVEVPHRYQQGFAAAGNDGFAIVVADPSACEACAQVEVRRITDGGLVSTTKIETAWGDGFTLGVSGAELWIYGYAPPESDHMLGGRYQARCQYAVFGLGDTSGRPRRTLADARDRWRELTTPACAVRALAPGPDGTVVVVRSTSPGSAEVVMLSGPP